MLAHTPHRWLGLSTGVVLFQSLLLPSPGRSERDTAQHRSPDPIAVAQATEDEDAEADENPETDDEAALEAEASHGLAPSDTTAGDTRPRGTTASGAAPIAPPDDTSETSAPAATFVPAPAGERLPLDPVTPTPSETPLPTTVSFVLDASGTMNRELGHGPATRIAAARIALRDAIRALAVHRNYTIHPRIFGPTGCNRSRVLPPATVEQTRATLRALAALGARGPSSLTAAVAAAERDLLSRPGRRVLVLLVDGVDGCGNALADLPLHPSIERHVLGFAVPSRVAGELLALGEYTEIRSLEDLTVALSRIASDVLSAPSLEVGAALNGGHSTSR